MALICRGSLRKWRRGREGEIASSSNDGAAAAAARRGNRLGDLAIFSRLIRELQINRPPFLREICVISPLTQTVGGKLHT